MLNVEPMQNPFSSGVVSCNQSADEDIGDLEDPDCTNLLQLVKDEIANQL